MDAPLPSKPRKGRGAVTNPAVRFEKTSKVAIDDGWGEASIDEVPRLATEITIDSTRSIIARNDSPDIGFDRSINPYRGCEHGCIYCFARPTHAFLGLSPGLDFESRLLIKPDAARLLEAELRRPSYRVAPIAMGTNTDPYQPVERERRITRAIIAVLAEYQHPLTIVTKSALVTRDIDLLAPMAAKGLVKVAVSLTTLDGDLARRMEPRAAAPAKRLETIARLAAAGIPVNVMTAPVIPGLTDHELERLLAAAKDAGARGAGYVLLRLPLEVAPLFTEWLEAHVPDRARRVLNLVRQCHGGELYDSTFRVRQRGKGELATLIAKRFDLACRKFGLDRTPWDLDCSRFRLPPRPGDQLTLL